MLKFLESLYANNSITTDEYNAVLEYMHNNKGTSVVNAILGCQIKQIDFLMTALSAFYKLPVIRDIRLDRLNQDLIDKFQIQDLINYKTIPIKFNSITGELNVVIVNPQSRITVDEYYREVINNINGAEISSIKYLIALEPIFEQWENTVKYKLDIDQVNNVLSDEVTLQLVNSTPADKEVDEVYNLTISEDNSVKATVDAILISAYNQGASDIHLEPFSEGLRVRYRIDGILQVVKMYPKKLSGFIVNRIRVLAGMDSNTFNETQGGNATLKFKNITFNIRASVIPTYSGDKLVIRLLDTKEKILNIKSLELHSVTEQKLENAINKPNGIIIIVGSVGSGKSTTLFTILNRLNTPDVSIATIENPVEHKILGASQSEVNEAQGLTFSHLFRELLRQDIDTAMVGEIRDEDTAAISVQAAMSGHLVLTTLHSSSACGAVARLGTLGVKPEDLSSSLNAIISQTLVRRLCPKCKEKYTLDVHSGYNAVVEGYEDRVLEMIETRVDGEVAKIEGYNKRARVLKRPEKPQFNREELIKKYINVCNLGGRVFYKQHKGGCTHCNGKGYLGRVVLMEFLEITPELRTAIQCSKTVHELEELALSQNLFTIKNEGVRKVYEGITSFEEIHRCLHFDYI